MMDALTTPDWGRWAAALALAFCVVQAVAGAADRLAVARRASLAAFGLTAFAMLSLISAFLASDFSLALVATHSHTDKPLLYKITAAWGNHEGSMLLWCLVLTGFSAAFAARPGVGPALTVRALSVLGALSVAFFAFTLFTSNPFAPLNPAPWEGQGFNPLLQDPALALHPPMLYLGYVGLAVPFALAVAALWSPPAAIADQQRAWARAQRRWALAGFAALTAGIGLGSYWAYYELGWGGWWFWDPVENASLMPWLLAAALFHSALVTERRGLVAGWTALLAILAFSLSIFGTFLTRSGVLTSVHAFAVDPSRGAVLLMILAAALTPALALFAWRGGALGAPGPTPRLFSREGLLILNNLFLVSAAAVVLTGTLWPLVVEGLGGPLLSVGPPYFNAAALPVSALAFAVTPLAVITAWGGGWAARERLWAGVALGLAGLAAAAMALAGGGFGPSFAVFTGAWMILGGGLHAAHALGLREAGWASALSRVRLRPTLMGGPIAHAGIGLLALGAGFGAAFPMERQGLLAAGERLAWPGGVAELRHVVTLDGPNYVADRARVIVTREGRAPLVFEPERRVYLASDGVTSEVAIEGELSGDVYIALGPPQVREDGGVSWTVRVTLHSMIWMVFWGAGLTALGAALAWGGVAWRARQASSSDATADAKRPGPAAPPAAAPASVSAGAAMDAAGGRS